MKRNFEAGNRAVFGDILKATTLEQRAWIGAIVLAYNAAEGELHKLTGASLGIIGIGPPYSVTSRINGTDGLIGIIHGTVTAMALSAEHAKLFNTTLSDSQNLRVNETRSFTLNCPIRVLKPELLQENAASNKMFFYRLRHLRAYIGGLPSSKRNSII